MCVSRVKVSYLLAMNACTDSCWSECLSLSFCVQFIANDGAVFVVQTDHNAANYCLMKIDINKPDKVLFIMHDHWCTEVWLTHIFAATIFNLSLVHSLTGRCWSLLTIKMCCSGQLVSITLTWSCVTSGT